MQLSTHIKPISYLKSHTAQIVKDISLSREPLLITKNGEAKLVVLDVKTYEEREATLDEGVMAAQRKLDAIREQHRALERQAQEAQFQGRSLVARKEELARNIALGVQQTANLKREHDQLDMDLLRMNDAAAQSGLQAALAL